MSEKNKVLVIIPAFNEEQSLPRVIEAVRDNPLPVDIVVIDDCSTDGSFALLKSIENIKLLQTPHNQGPSQANLLGVNNIDTAYTVVLDGDDTLVDGALDYYIKLLNKPEEPD